MPRRVIALLSDFGTRDGYAGAMKGVLARDAPDASLVDVTHDVPPGDVLHAAWVLATVWDHFPDGTVFLCVVDPGVGSSRRAVALAARDRFGVGPDNGLFTFIAATEAVALRVEAEASAVFHGRDVFAPAAAALAKGARLSELGTPASGLVALPDARPAARADGSIAGHVIHVDGFGNCVTDVPAALLRARVESVTAGGARTSRVVRYYAEAAAGDLVALVNSAGHLELALRDGSASERFDIRRGAPVLVRFS